MYLGSHSLLSSDTKFLLSSIIIRKDTSTGIFNITTASIKLGLHPLYFRSISSCNLTGIMKALECTVSNNIITYSGEKKGTNSYSGN